MMMKRLFATLAALVLLLAVTAPALAEEGGYTLEGYVTATMEDGFTIDDKALGEVLLNVDATTVYDGILADSPIEVGLYVFVSYDGRMTRSIPPQAHADKVGCYVLNGVAGEFLPDGVMLMGDELFGDVFVRFEPAMAHVFPGAPMTVYYNGVMAMSLPGQVNAAAIIVPTLEGSISGLNEDSSGFTLQTDEGESVLVTLDGATLIGRLLNTDADEGEADVGFEIGIADNGEDDNSSEVEASADNKTGDAGGNAGGDAGGDASGNADGLANTDWTIDTDAELREGYELLSPEALSTGDRVRVYYNGEYTRENADEEVNIDEEEDIGTGEDSGGDDGTESRAESDTDVIQDELPPRVYALEVLMLGE